MSATIDIAYEGDLRCSANHRGSGDRLVTDAPTDNKGLGRHFSPTDLVATALGTCILTIMGFAAQRRGFALDGARVQVDKTMGAKPRHIAGLTLRFELPAALDTRARRLLEAVADTCPVTHSLNPETNIVLEFAYVG